MDQLIEMLEKYTKEPLNLRDYFQVIHDANDFHKQFYIDEDGFSHLRVFDQKKVLQEHTLRKRVPFYPVTKEQLLTAGEYEFVERNKGYVQLVSFLTENFKINKADADQIAKECVYATKNGDSPNDVLQYLSKMLEFENEETLHKLVDRVIFLMNNTREWFLKGHTSTELSKVEKKHLQPLPGNKNNSKSGEVIKVGRNDRCSCGSGKKYKKCCG
ncbi:SEC-C metal-binding domain-containing protein [Bacillus sp. AFS040349]|uniref:SEC-C metal-binding domain-containing protein n=1 Tax=Bacillus sp. AFS040349 TaxID=2033502 RepID=UPI002100052B|nr:SEC-C metal-binding domain-containing protein [Bacillus sp. AFS040349]